MEHRQKSRLPWVESGACAAMEDTEENRVWWLRENKKISLRHVAPYIPMKHASEHIKEAFDTGA